MNYRKIYDNIINRAKNRKLTGYAERHHIIPKCMDGKDFDSNTATVTAKEHFICHSLLVEIYPNNNKLKFALWMMCSMDSTGKRYKVSSRAYERIKKDLVKSQETKNKISESLKKAYKENRRTKRTGVKMPKEFGESISKSKKGMIGTNLGKKMSKKQKLKISNALLRHEVSDLTREKIRKTLLNRNNL